MKVSFDPPRTPDRIDGIRVSYGIKKRFVARWRWYLVLLLVLSPLLYFVVSLVGHTLILIAPGITNYNTYVLVAPISGILQLKPLREGDSVAKSQVLGYVDNEETLKRIELLKSLAIQTESISSRKPLAEAMTLAKRSVAHQADYLARIKRLMEQGAASRAEYNEAEIRYEAVLSQLAQLETTITTNNYTLQPRKELELLEKTKETLIISPSDGILLHSFLKDGQYVVQGTHIMEFAQKNTLTFTVYLSPANAHKAIIGKKVTIRSETGTKFNATVESVKPLTEKMPSSIKRSFVRDERLALPVILHVENPPKNIPHNTPFTVLFGIFL